MFKMKKFAKREYSPSDPRILLKKRAKHVLKDKGYKYLASIGSGTFGDVIACKSQNKKVAVKIIASEMLSTGESDAWSHLSHPNVLPLLSIISLPDCDLFVMPLHRNSMAGFLKDKRFRSNSAGFEFTKAWLKDILLGLEYLHNNRVCHLDLKADNVLITKKMEAVICDFSCLSTTEMCVGRYGLPHYFRPPEACLETCQSLMVEGVPFDVWSFGLMTLHIWTVKWFEDTIYDLKYNWAKHVYPLLFQALQPSVFGKLLKSTFPRASISNEEIELALNLVQGTMKHNPQERPGASLILKHVLFSKDAGGCFLFPDGMWHMKLTTEAMPVTEIDYLETPNISYTEAMKPVENDIDEAFGGHFNNHADAFVYEANKGTSCIDGCIKDEVLTEFVRYKVSKSLNDLLSESHFRNELKGAFSDSALLKEFSVSGRQTTKDNVRENIENHAKNGNLGKRVRSWFRKKWKCFRSLNCCSYKCEE